MIDFFRMLRGCYRRCRRAKSHPGIRNSVIGQLGQVDVGAQISNCELSGNVEVGRRCVLDSCNLRANSRLAIGDYSILTGPISIIADLNPVTIGKFCSIAPDVSIWESMHDYHRLTSYFIHSSVLGEDFRKDAVSKGPVSIGNDVWIGTKSVVLSGVTIGDGAIVGAGSIVKKDVPAYTIAVGNPAVPVRSRFPLDVISELQELRWWDWDEARISLHRHVWGEPLSLELLRQIRTVESG
jgi:virginiamycin A acetyltransferase